MNFRVILITLFFTFTLAGTNVASDISAGDKKEGLLQRVIDLTQHRLATQSHG